MVETAVSLGWSIGFLAGSVPIEVVITTFYTGLLKPAKIVGPHSIFLFSCEKRKILRACFNITGIYL